MLASIIFHCLAGAVAGSVFKVRTLLMLLGVVLVESAILALAHDGIAALWALVDLVGVQVGYLAGIYARSVLEQAGYLLPRIQTRELP